MMKNYDTQKSEEAPRSSEGQISKSAKSIARLRLIIKRENGQKVVVEGRPAQTILFLRSVGEKGATRLEFSAAGWARSVSSYIFDLRKLGFAIETTMEEVEANVRVARYTLKETIKVTL